MPPRKPLWVKDTKGSELRDQQDYEYAQAIYALRGLIDANWELKCLHCTYRRYDCGSMESLVDSWALSHAVRKHHTTEVYNVAILIRTYDYHHNQPTLEPPF